LSESIPIVSNTELGMKVTVESIEGNIETLYPHKYSANTKRSIATKHCQFMEASWFY